MWFRWIKQGSSCFWISALWFKRELAYVERVEEQKWKKGRKSYYMGMSGKATLGACRGSMSRTRWPAVGGLIHLMLSWMTSMVLVERFARFCVMSASHKQESVSQREERQKTWLFLGPLHIDRVLNILLWIYAFCNLGGHGTYSITGFFHRCRCSIDRGDFCLVFTSLNNISSTGKRSLQSAEPHALLEEPLPADPQGGSIVPLCSQLLQQFCS